MQYFSIQACHFVAFLNSLFTAKPLALFLGVRRKTTFSYVHSCQSCVLSCYRRWQHGGVRLNSATLDLVTFPSDVWCSELGWDYAFMLHAGVLFVCFKTYNWVDLPLQVTFFLQKCKFPIRSTRQQWAAPVERLTGYTTKCIFHFCRAVWRQCCSELTRCG